MLEALMTVMSSSAVGAITGGFFGWLNRREERQIRLADQAHERKMGTAQSHADTMTSEARAFEESQKTIGSISAAIKSVVRPLITGALLYMTYGILVELQRMTGGLGNLPADEAAAIYRDINLNIISLTATAVSWWFASRPTSHGGTSWSSTKMTPKQE